MALYDYKGNDLIKKFITGKISYEDCKKLITRQMEEEIYKEVKEKLEQTGISGSKIQNYICEVYNGVSSVKVGCYLVDMIIDNNIVCEVDGGGHTLKIKFKKEKNKQITK